MANVTSFSVITTGYAVLALVADAMVLAVVIFFALSRLSPARRDQWSRFRDGVTPIALHMAWIVAMLATLGSLYLSQIAGDQPCEFCWFQRICMYPLSLLLGIAAFRGDIRIAKRYFMTFPVVGSILAIYHYQLEHVPNEHANCGPVSCSTPIFNIFGFISVPFLSMAAFFLIITLLLLARAGDDDDEEYLEADDDETAGAESADDPAPATA